MIKISRHRLYADYISHHPIEQIDEVTELCVESSAVQSFLAFPIGLCVVPVVSIPEAIQLHAQNSTELPFIDGFLHRLDRRIETVLLDDVQVCSCLFSGFVHPPAVPCRDSHGLLAQDVCSRAKTFDGLFGVQGIRSANGY